VEAVIVMTVALPEPLKPTVAADQVAPFWPGAHRSAYGPGPLEGRVPGAAVGEVVEEHARADQRIGRRYTWARRGVGFVLGLGDGVALSVIGLVGAVVITAAGFKGGAAGEPTTPDGPIRYEATAYPPSNTAVIRTAPTTNRGRRDVSARRWAPTTTSSSMLPPTLTSRREEDEPRAEHIRKRQCIQCGQTVRGRSEDQGA
jgi:hypothetical protein